MLVTNASARRPSSDLLFDPSEDILGLGNCTSEQAMSCPQCGKCTCSVYNVARFPDLTKFNVERKVDPTCPLHGKGALHPLPDVYDEPRVLAAIRYEEAKATLNRMSGSPTKHLFSLEKYERGRWNTPNQLVKAMSATFGHCELGYDDTGKVIVNRFADGHSQYLGHVSADSKGNYITVLPSPVDGRTFKPWSDPDSDPIADIEAVVTSVEERTSGGYSTRAIVGRPPDSLHGTGMAVDVNFDTNPFTIKKSDATDAMHFELDARAIWGRISGGPQPGQIVADHHFAC